MHNVISAPELWTILKHKIWKGQAGISEKHMKAKAHLFNESGKQKPLPRIALAC